VLVMCVCIRERYSSTNECVSVFELVSYEPSDVCLTFLSKCNSGSLLLTNMILVSETILTPQHKSQAHTEFTNCYISANVQVIYVEIFICFRVCPFLQRTRVYTSGLNGLDLSLFLCNGPSPVSGLSWASFSTYFSRVNDSCIISNIVLYYRHIHMYTPHAHMHTSNNHKRRPPGQLGTGGYKFKGKGQIMACS
jgi:hypothetical protein